VSDAPAGIDAATEAAPSVPTSAPTLTDGVVTLRAHSAEDIDDILLQGRDPEMQRWTTVPSPYERTHAEMFALQIMPEGWAIPLGPKGFAIEAVADGRPRFAGTVDFRPSGARTAEIGFGLAPWARGRGLMTRAVRLALDWAFDALDLEAVHWRANVGNFASRRVATACGFRIEGTVRALLPDRGALADAWLGSLLRGEPRDGQPRWLEAPVLQGDSVVLRPWADGDLRRIVEACSDPESQRWLPDLPTPFLRADAEHFLLRQRTMLADRAGVGWAMADPVDGRCLGAMTLFGLERIGREAELGYWIHPDARGRGLTTQAARLAVRHAFVPVEDGGLGLGRVELRAAAGNPASLAIARRVGFREIGRQRGVDPQPDGTIDDLVAFDLLAEDFSA
jgi:RimJ/RimL family protein N-acetyltransferase